MRPKKQVGSLFLVIEKFLANFSSKIILPNNSWTEYKIANECPEFFTYFIRLYNFDLFVGPKIQWIIYLGLRMRVWDCMRLCIFIIAYGSLEERKFRFWLFEILFVDGVGFYLMALANHKTYNISRVGYRERDTHTHAHIKRERYMDRIPIKVRQAHIKIIIRGGRSLVSNIDLPLNLFLFFFVRVFVLLFSFHPCSEWIHLLLFSNFSPLSEWEKRKLYVNSLIALM